MKEVEQAWLEYQAKLFAFIRSKVGTPEDAEDILSDVFSKLIGTAIENTIPDNVSSWLYRVTKNRIVDYYRAKKKLEVLPEDFAVETEDPNIIGQLSRCMLPMINALPETFRQALIYSEIEGKKYKEVANDLGLTVPAVKSRILRGRGRLYKSMVNCCAIYHNGAGRVVDYEQKMARFCNHCED